MNKIIYILSIILSVIVLFSHCSEQASGQTIPSQPEGEVFIEVHEIGTISLADNPERIIIGNMVLLRGKFNTAVRVVETTSNYDESFEPDENGYIDISLQFSRWNKSFMFGLWDDVNEQWYQASFARITESSNFYWCFRMNTVDDEGYNVYYYFVKNQSANNYPLYFGDTKLNNDPHDYFTSYRIEPYYYKINDTVTRNCIIYNMQPTGIDKPVAERPNEEFPEETPGQYRFRYFIPSIHN